MSLADLKKALKEKKVTLGGGETVKKVRLGKVSTIFIAEDCKPSVEEQILYYQKMGKFNVVELDVKSGELGTLCKKQFPVSVLSY